MINHLGPYKIVEQIGAGAMGEVYLAEDTRLGRKVAIKVLPPDLARQPERLARFEREARAAAALNHPNIASVFDVGFENLNVDPDDATGDISAPAGLHFIVQEFLEGVTLRQRLEGRSLALVDVLRLAAEMAEALSAAHEAGIVHRDLKPDNVFVTESGHAKVLDFGLAKLIQDPHEAQKTGQPSATLPDSIAGRLVGTPGYMSPEQVNGEPSDRRADIFAFGSMLYEMSAGRRAFAGRSAAESLSQIVHDEPVPLGELNEKAPLELCRIVGKCLQKEPQRRYQSAADLALDLHDLRATVENGTAVPVGARNAGPGAAGDRLGKTGLAAIVVTALLAVLLTWTVMSEPPPVDVPVLRFSVNLPEGIEMTRTERPIVDFSRDGQELVVAADGALWLHRLSDEGFTLLQGSESASRGGYAVAPAFSPDGTQVAFFLDDAIRSVPLTGGAPTVLVDVDIPSAIRWEVDGYIYYTQSIDTHGEVGAFGSDGIWRVPQTGGTPEVVVATEPDRRAAAPQLLPGNEWLLYSTTSASEFVVGDDSHEEVVAQSLRTGERRDILSDGFAGRYVDTGHIVYVQDNSLWAIPFNLDGLRTTGAARRLIDSVPMSSWAGTPYLGIADNGNLVVPALALLEQRNGQVSWVDPDGAVEPLEVPMADNPRLSKDGKKLAVEVRGVAETHIWVHEMDRGSWTELTTEAAGAAPVWSADGRWVYFMREDTDGRAAVWRKSVDFTSPADLLWRPEGHIPYPESVPDDGRFLLYSASLPDQNDIWLLWRTGDRSAIPLTQTATISEEGAQAHPSGRWIVYTALEVGRSQIFVQELSENGSLGRRYTISASGGAEPMWSRDGTMLYYRIGTQLIAVDIDTEPEFHAGEPRVLLREFPGDAPVLRADYDVAPDGRVITAIPQSQWSWQRLDVVINWFRESGLRAPS
ncbi:MAG: protein kinase [Acidobacteriota bacterium]|jgi:serine/threonine-protein kinase